MNPKHMTRIVNQKKYDTQTATLLASDEYWDGHNDERHGRNTFLYRTSKGSYFQVTLTQWEDEEDTLNPISQEEAIQLYETSLKSHEVSYGEAFPNVIIEEA